MPRSFPRLLFLAGVSGVTATLVVGAFGMLPFGGAGLARADSETAGLVASGAGAAALALGPDGTPYVAFVRSRSLVVSHLGRDGRWRSRVAVALSAASSYRVQLVVDGGGRPTALVQDVAGRWLGLAEPSGSRWRWRQVASSPSSRSTLGPAGLALDRLRRPVVASAFSNGPDASFLRLLEPSGSTSAWTSITRQGFPSSVEPPAAMPVVLADGRVHVVESFGVRRAVQGVEWGLESDGWWGQSLASGSFDRSTGPVAAAVDRHGTVYSAWTALGFGSSLVVVARHRGETEESRLVPGGSMGALALTGSGAEVGVNRTNGTAAVIDERGRTATVDGRIAGLTSGPHGARTLLVSRGGSLYLYRTPRPLVLRVHLRVNVAEDRVLLSGRVSGASRGHVVLSCVSAGGRQLLGSVPLRQGSFELKVSPGPCSYRAVYVDRATGIPYVAVGSPTAAAQVPA